MYLDEPETFILTRPFQAGPVSKCEWAWGYMENTPMEVSKFQGP